MDKRMTGGSIYGGGRIYGGGSIYGGGPISKNKSTTRSKNSKSPSIRRPSPEPASTNNKGEPGLIEQNRRLKAENNKLKAYIKKLENK